MRNVGRLLRIITWCSAKRYKKVLMLQEMSRGKSWLLIGTNF